MVPYRTNLVPWYYECEMAETAAMAAMAPVAETAAMAAMASMAETAAHPGTICNRLFMPGRHRPRQVHLQAGRGP